MLSQTQSCTMIATTTITIVVVAAQIIAGANSLSEEADNKISTLSGQPTVEFKQYGGYITVDEVQQRALVYYFVEAKVEPASKPVVLWLNGGMCCMLLLCIWRSKTLMFLILESE